MNKTVDTLIFQRRDWRKIGRSAIYCTTRNVLMQIALPLYFLAISARHPCLRCRKLASKLRIAILQT